MSKKGVRKYTLKPYESSNPMSDTTANISHSMLVSDAWKDITSKQKVLYVVCKDQQYRQRAKNKPVVVSESEEKSVFAMNTAIFTSKAYGLYKESDKKSFYRDMSALIEHGLIDCIHRGDRSRNAYRYSSRWTTWEPGQATPERYMTQAMINRKNKPVNSG